MQPRVFVARQIPEAGLRLIQGVTECEVWQGRLPPPKDVLLQKCEGCDGILTLLSDSIDDDFLDGVGSHLKVVSNFAVGYNNIDVAAATRRGVAVGNTPGVLTDSTADIAVSLLLAAARCLKHGIHNVDRQEWLTWEPTGFIGQDLSGKTIGIVGMGRIGYATARRLHAGWGMKVVYTSRSDKPEADTNLSATRVSLEELLRCSDFVSVHTDLNSSTVGMFDKTAFAQMKNSAVFVNTSRGGVVDEAALHDALTTNQVFAAGIDVTAVEPLPADSQLRDLENCVILPHIGSGTVSSRDAMATIAAENLIAGVNGKPLPHPVN